MTMDQRAVWPRPGSASARDFIGSCDLLVLVDQTAQPLAAYDP